MLPLARHERRVQQWRDENQCAVAVRGVEGSSVLLRGGLRFVPSPPACGMTSLGCCSGGRGSGRGGKCSVSWPPHPRPLPRSEVVSFGRRHIARERGRSLCRTNVTCCVPTVHHASPTVCRMANCGYVTNLRFPWQTCSSAGRISAAMASTTGTATEFPNCR
jgi:hypothetical protein